MKTTGKYPIEILLALREQGLSYREIGKRTDRPAVQYGEVTTYKLSHAEIERRYGKPGEFAEPVSTAVTNGWPGGGEANERHYARRDL